MKKLLLTTAMVAVAFSNNSFAEMKISGSLEQTYTSYSFDRAVDEVLGSAAIGSESNLSFTGSKAVAGGTVNGAIRIEDKGSTLNVDQKELGFTVGNFKAHVGIDTGATIVGNMVAHVGQQAEDVFAGLTGELGADGLSAFSAHDKEHVGISYKSPVGSFAVNYAPSNAERIGANAATDNGGSATEYVFTGNLGVKGLDVKIGQQDSNSAHGSASDQEEKFYGATYSYGQVKVGYSLRDFDDKAINVENDKSTSTSIAFAVSPNLSVAFERLETSKIGSTDEELDILGVSYNLGGLGIEAYYGMADNIGGTPGKEADAFQLRTVFAY
jgi:hypothetical protein